MGSVTEEVRPADVEGGVGYRTFWVFRVLGDTVNGTHGGQFAAAVHALLDPATADVDPGIAFHTACPFHWGYVNEGFHKVASNIFNDSEFTDVGSVTTTVAAAEHIAPDGTALNGDSGILVNSTELTAAIHTAFDDSVAFDGQVGLLHLGQVRPDGVDITVEQGDTSHTSGKHVTANETFAEVGMMDGFVVVADDTATDVDGDDTVLVAVLHVAIVWVRIAIRKCRAGKLSTDRSQTATTVDGTEHLAATDVDVDVAAHRTCGESLARETTTCTEDVTVHVGVT